MNTPKDILALFGNNLRLLRHKKNLSQLALSEITGKSHTFINNIENGKKWISAETLSILCTALDASEYEFFLTDDIRDTNTVMALTKKHKEFLGGIKEMVSRYGEDST